MTLKPTVRSKWTTTYLTSRYIAAYASVNGTICKITRAIKRVSSPLNTCWLPIFAQKLISSDYFCQAWGQRWPLTSGAEQRQTFSERSFLFKMPVSFHGEAVSPQGQAAATRRAESLTVQLWDTNHPRGKVSAFQVGWSCDHFKEMLPFGRVHSRGHYNGDATSTRCITAVLVGAIQSTLPPRIVSLSGAPAVEEQFVAHSQWLNDPCCFGRSLPDANQPTITATPLSCRPHKR